MPQKGQRTSTTIDLAGALIGETCLVMVADYPNNVTIYELTYGGESETTPAGCSASPAAISAAPPTAGWSLTRNHLVRFP